MTNLLTFFVSFLEMNRKNIVFPNQFFYRKMEYRESRSALL